METTKGGAIFNTFINKRKEVLKSLKSRKQNIYKIGLLREQNYLSNNEN